MPERQRGFLTTVYALAGHLDTALVACDDLLSSPVQDLQPHSTLRLQLTVITHVLQARQSAAEMHLADRDLARRLISFVLETDLLEFASAADATGDQAGEEALIGGCIPILDLKSLLASLLNALDGRYILDPLASEDDPLATPPQASYEGQVWAQGPE